MTEAEKAFEHYMDEIIQWAGQTGKRRLIWSIPRCTLGDIQNTLNEVNYGKATQRKSCVLGAGYASGNPVPKD